MNKIVPGFFKDRLDGKYTINPKTGCWEWNGVLDSHGYGTIYAGIGIYPRTWKAHRYAWRVYNGEIPDGIFVCHKCDNPKCINPEHLFLGTALDNTTDMDKKGRCTRASGNDHYKATLNINTVSEIKKDIINGFTKAEIMAKYHIGDSKYSEIRKGRSWKNVLPMIPKKDKSKKVKRYSLEDMETAYNDGVNEGQSQSGNFEWGIRRKDIDFTEWLSTFTPSLPPQPVKDDWVSVEDGLPEVENVPFNDSAYVLCGVLGSDNSKTFVGWYNHKEKIWRVAHYFSTSESAEVTHWQPLPHPPKEDKTKEI